MILCAQVSEEISALAVEECESCDVEITEQETHSCSFLDPDSDNELMTATNITYLLHSNTPEYEKHCRLAAVSRTHQHTWAIKHYHIKKNQSINISDFNAH